MIRLAFRPERLEGGRILLTPAEGRYLRQVMRMEEGTVEAVLSGRGGFLAELAPDGKSLQVGRQLSGPVTPPVRITLIQAVLKQDRMASVIERGTEVGIVRFEAWVAERSVARDVSGARLERWQRIAKEATEQSGGTEIPAVAVHSGDFAAVMGERLLLFDPQGRPIRQWWGDGGAGAGAIRAVVGPEGGISPGERARLLRAGYDPVSLGPRIYRAENAGVFGALLLLWLAEAVP